MESVIRKVNGKDLKFFVPTKEEKEKLAKMIKRKEKQKNIESMNSTQFYVK